MIHFLKVQVKFALGYKTLYFNPAKEKKVDLFLNMLQVQYKADIISRTNSDETDQEVLINVYGSVPNDVDVIFVWTI